MKKIVDTFKNIFRIKDLRDRILITLLFVFIYRVGSFIALPGVDVHSLKGLENQTAEGIMGLLNMFSGGAFSNASIFALGIMPYISASIVIQLMTVALPSFKKMQRDGESGRRKLTQYTRILTVVILLLQGPAYLVNLHMQAAQAVPTTFWFNLSSTLILCGGSMFVMWLGERITDKGIGNGISFVILIGIIARLLPALGEEFAMSLTNAGGLIKFILEIIFLLIVIGLALLLVQGVRRVPVQYAKQMSTVGEKAAINGARQFIPLKVYAANVMPIIFAQAIMFIPYSVAPLFGENAGAEFQTYFDYRGVAYNVLFALLIIAFTYFYTAITIQPTQMAEDMKRSGSFIPGVKPGTDTAEYIDTIMSRITLPGALFLAFLAILPSIVGPLVGINSQFAQFFGGTSLLIMVGVVLDTCQQVESHLLMHNYDGMMTSGRIQGRGLVSTDSSK
ncbi:MAG: preprotein translocase subunit SecY [Paludibacteraceae bacterium]|nr:preprotein translocase subunit SecY [Paludibacteraceae bacterium]